MILLRRFFAVFILSTLSFQGKAQVDPALAALLQNTVDSLQQVYQVKGVSAAAYIPGQGIWYGAAGESHAGVPVDSNMLFAMASITKTFIAAEVLKVVESGQLGLNDSLHEITGPRTNINPNITVRNLLQHRSGIGDFTNITWQNAMFANPLQTWYFPQAMDSFITPQLFNPGSGANYCNANYSMLGILLEEQLGDSLHKSLRDSLLTPFSLGSTFMETFESYPNTIAHNWSAPNFNPALAVDCVSTPHEALWSSVEACGGYFSNPIDLVKWGHALYSGEVLAPSSLTAMTNFSTVNSSYYNGYGLGCQRFPYMSRTYWGHGGNYYGYASSMMYYPQDSVCVAVMINQDVNGTFLGRVLIHTLVNAMATGTEEVITATTFTCYPNPSNEIVTIELGAVPASLTTVTLTDLAGRVVHKETMTGSAARISTGEFPMGVYVISVESEGMISTERLVISH